jgi:hypothetical protein
MLFKVESAKPLDEIERGLQESAARHQFGIIAIHDLKETLAKKGVDLAQQCRVYEVCNRAKPRKSWTLTVAFRQRCRAAFRYTERRTITCQGRSKTRPLGWRESRPLHR